MLKFNHALVRICFAESGTETSDLSAIYIQLWYTKKGSICSCPANILCGFMHHKIDGCIYLIGIEENIRSNLVDIIYSCQLHRIWFDDSIPF